MPAFAEEDAPRDPLRIRRVRNAAGLREFLEFPYRLNAHDPMWVPPLRRDQRVLLDRDKHPFHRHARVEYFLARRGGRTVGRIAAIENFRHNAYHKERIGFFGFLDAEDDEEAFAGLLGAAERWARGRGLEALRGPCSFSTNEECGLLVGNYVAPPVIMTPYHRPYYKEHIEGLGYAKAEDLLCFHITRDDYVRRIRRLAKAVHGRLERRGIQVSIRCLDKSRFVDEVRLVRDIYNSAWKDNWGFVPMTDEEVEFIAKELRLVAVSKFILFAEIDGKPAAFLMALPDYNTLLHQMDGRLSVRSLLTAALLRRRVQRMRLMMLGVLPEHRNRGLDLLMYEALFENAAEKAYSVWDLSWILERNERMIATIKATGAREWRRYRLYEKALG